VISKPEELHDRFAEAANAGDVVRMVDLYEPDAVIVERDGRLTRGTDAIRRHVKDLLALRPKMEIVTSRSFQNGDLALLCSAWRAHVLSVDGKETTMDHRGSEVLRRQPDGTWRLALDNPWGIEVAS